MRFPKPLLYTLGQEVVAIFQCQDFDREANGEMRLRINFARVHSRKTLEG